MAVSVVQPRVVQDLSGGFDAGSGPLGGIHETNHVRDLNLIIRPEGTVFRLTIDGPPDVKQEFGADLEHVLPITLNDLWGLAQTCRDAWHRSAVNLLDHGERVFQRYWDFSNHPGYLHRPRQGVSVERELAEAGLQLFLGIFHPSPAGGDSVEGLHRIAEVLRRIMPTTRGWIKITSADFFAPWNLIYSSALPPDRTAPVDPAGFWGYQHVVEHVPDDSGSLRFAPLEGASVNLGLQIDTELDRNLGVACLETVRQELARYNVADLCQVERSTKDALRVALANGLSEQILYFCCHGSQEGDQDHISAGQGRLVLSDVPVELAENWIKPPDIELWLDFNNLAAHPLVFLNACSGGQINSTFYKGFGRIFLGRQAACVIGPQTDIPALFAGQFASQFFARLLAGGSQNQVGTILFDLRREYYDRHNNPLGLLYSLYRGGDVYLHRGLTAKANGLAP